MSLEITSGVVVYRLKENKIQYLLLKSGNQGHFWGFPKGHVEAREDLITTAHREIFEETQLDLAIDESFQVKTEYDLPNGNHKEMTLFTAEVKGNQLIELQTVEIDGSQWLNYRTARERLTYDNLKGLLDQVNEHLENQNEK